MNTLLLRFTGITGADLMRNSGAIEEAILEHFPIVAPSLILYKSKDRHGYTNFLEVLVFSECHIKGMSVKPRLLC